MKSTIWGISSAGLVLAAAAVYHTALAGETKPAIRVDSTPINRDPQTGNSYAPIVRQVAPSVVNIYSTRIVRQRFYRHPMMADPFFRQFFGNQFPDDSRELTRRDNWLGSGMIVSPDGYILTANHVVDGADEIKVGLQNEKKEYSAKVIGTDPATDIAVLKIEASNLPAIVLGDSDQLEVGDVVLAIGNPFGIGKTVTRGIISALGRSLPVDNDPYSARRSRYQDFIQTDAAINQGNSGGALVDVQGRLIGINDAIVSPSGTSAGVGFAVPINLARSVMEGFLSGGKVVRGFLGLEPQDIDAGLAKSFGVPATGGVLVADVGPGTPAEAAGLKDGDVIVAINNRDISGAENFRVTVSQLRPGVPASLKIIRNGSEKVISATPGERPEFSQAPVMPAKPKPEGTVADALDGVQVQNLSAPLRQQLHTPADLAGAVVTDVDSASNSSAAGLRPGDVIVEINHEPVAGAEDAVRLGKAARGGQILLKIWRNDAGITGTRFLSVDNARRAK